MATPRRISAEIVTSTESTSNASGAPTTLISAPAIPGPATSAPEDASAFFACASTSRSRATTCVSTICAADPATVAIVPSANAAKYIHGIASQPPTTPRGR
jgi:hypothetical protein